MRLYCNKCGGYYVPPISNHKCQTREDNMKLIDSDNLISTPLTDYLVKEISAAIDSGKIKDWSGDVYPASDYIDGDGDMCVDEIMYDDILDMFFTR